MFPRLTTIPGLILLPILAAPWLQGGCHDEAPRTVSVAGTGIHYLTTAMIHSKQPTENGMIQKSTEIVELDGDLTGRVLYHPTSVFADATLVNTGSQVFSGTVLGSEPVLLYDDTFRFEVDLDTGATIGDVHFTDGLAGPQVACDLRIVGTGLSAEGEATFSYTGACRMHE